MADKRKRLMLESEIPDFIEDVIKSGCDICAIGHDMYVFGDADIPYEDYDEVGIQVKRIREKCGDRDNLTLEIVAHFRSLGLYLTIPVSRTGRKTQSNIRLLSLRISNDVFGWIAFRFIPFLPTAG